MTELSFHLAGAPLANLLIFAGLALIAFAILGGAGGATAGGSTVRTLSALIGTVLLFYVYGIYNHRAAHPQCDQAQHEPTAEAQSTRIQLPRDPAQQAATQPVQQAGPRPVQPAPDNLFSGKWKNADPKTTSVVFLKVEQQGDAVSVRAWGVCTSQVCDWGTGQGSVSAGAANVSWDQGPVRRKMRLVPAAGSLRMVLDSAYRDNRHPQHLEEHFEKTP